MKFINRCVVTLKPKAALVDWVNSLDTEVPDIWDFEGGAYLLDDHESEETLMKDIEQKATAMLENELATWTEDENLWPQKRDYQNLTELFDLHIAVAAFDTSKENLLRANVADIL